MMSRFLVAMVLFFSCIFSAEYAKASSQYQQYQAFEDTQGNIYLQLPKQFVLIHSEISIPLSIYPENALVKLYKDGTQWKIEILNEAQFNALTLSPSDYAIEYIDFSGDGDVEVILRADSISDDSFILYGLENGSVSFSVHNKYTDGVDISQTSGAQFNEDVNNDGYIDIVYDGYTLLGNAQDKFFNTSRYKVTQSSIVGSTGGEFRVAEDGSATYQIPLKLPQGIADVTPQMAFSYSSNAGNGNMGRGWSLSGINSISRCPKNYAQDDYIQGVKLNIDDVYCYKGQRLILQSGTHGTVNAKYHTELANFSVITISSANANGATSFEVETKSGETHYFGLATDFSTAKAYVGSETAPSAYLLAAIKDVKNNEILYNYKQEDNADEVNLKTITWGDSVVPNKLTVVYSDNPRPLYGFRNGREFSQTKFIQSVQIEQSGELIREYNLAWDHGELELNNVLTPVTENISRVDAIQECLIADGEQHCLAPTKFQWSSLQNGSTLLKVCTDYSYGFGYGPFCKEFIDQEVQAPFKPFGDSNLLTGKNVDTALKSAVISLAGDANGDGISDIFYVKDNKWHLSVMSVSGAGIDRTISVERTNTAVSVATNYEYAQVIDLNGDGRQTIVFPSSAGKWGYLQVGTVTQYNGRPDETGGEITVDSLNVSLTSVTFTGDEYKNTTFLDVNGDSFIDLVKKTEDGLIVHYNDQGTLNGTGVNILSNSVPANNVSNGTVQLVSQTPDLKNTAFFDVNGDGISDILTKISRAVYYCDEKIIGETDYYIKKSGDNKAFIQNYCNNKIEDSTGMYAYRFREGETTKRPVVIIGQVSTDGTPNYSNYYEIDFLFNLDISKDTRIADFNGDGLSDIIYRKANQWHIAQSKGDGSFVLGSINTSWLNADDASKYNKHRFMDINGDGLTDILAYSSGYKVYLSKTELDAVPTFKQRLSFLVYPEDNKPLLFADFDGDTQLDFIYVSSNKVRYKLAANPQQRKNVIELIESGFGQITSINYGLLHENGNDTNLGSPYLNGLSATRGAADNDYSTFFKSDFVQPNKGIWVVNNVSNIGYNSFEDETNAISISYKYSGMLLHKLGRGSAGFAELQTTDNTSGIITTTQYSQEYPYIGMPTSTITTYNGLILSEATNSFNTQDTSLSGTNFGLYPYIEFSRDKKWSLSHNNSQRSFSSHSLLESTYDNFGNLTYSTSKQFSDATESTVLAEVITDNEYFGLGGGAAKGRLSKTEVTHIRDNESRNRTSTFEYYDSNTDSPGMLKWSLIEGLNKKTTYEYDSYGNKNKICVSDLNTNKTRCSTTQWSDDGRFVLSTTNALNQSETYLYNGQAGSVNGRVWSKTTTGPNGIATTQYFGIQGELIKEQRADGTQTSITRAYSNSTNLNNCFLNSEKVCFYEKTQSTAKPDSYTWYDALGRKIKTQVRAFDGSQWSSQYFTFDELSRGKTTTIAYYESTPNGNAPSGEYVTEYFYDVLGRVTAEKLAGSNAINSREYFGFMTKYTDAEGKTRQEYTNALGELDKVTSMAEDVYLNGQTTTNVINTTQYNYDVFGKLTRVDNFASNDTNKKMSIYNVYDSYGRKTDMYDPDKGHWQYTYNAFGELLTQTTAEGVVTTNYYDIAGRKYRTETPSYDGYPAKVSCYAYGNDKAKRNVGKLIDSRQYSTTDGDLSTFNCASSNIEWQQTQTFDVLGRPDATTTKYDNKTFTQSQTYDSSSRVVTQTLPEGVVVTNYYANNYLKRVSQNGYTLREIEERNAAGQIKKESIAENIERENIFNETTGRIDSITVSKDSGGQIIHTLSYTYDNVGNLTDRTHNFQNSHYIDEDFTYDNLHRLEKREIYHTGLTNLDEFDYEQHYKYDFIGNIGKKYSVSTLDNSQILVHNYAYSWQAHAQSTNEHSIARYKLTGVTKDSNNNFRDFEYDSNGNVTSDGGRDYKYTSFDKPYKLTSTNGYSEFKYGPARNRYQRIDSVIENGETVEYKTSYLGAYERIEKTVNSATTIEHKYQIAGAIITLKEGESTYTRLFAHADVQGSITTITDGQGNVAEQFIYDPWGKKQAIVVNNTVNHLVANMVRGSATTRGYTGHESISHMGLIHMNGRIYDPTLGRFLQADPHIQAPNNSQNYNRYAYVLNNPMSYTDPSGYFFKKLFKGIKKYWRVIAAAVATYFTAGLASGWATGWAASMGLSSTVYAGGFAITTLSTAGSIFVGAVSGAIAGAVGGAIATGSLKGALRGATSGAVFGAIGGYGIESTGGQVAAHAVAGGILSDLQGGNFGHGFWTAGIMKGIGKFTRGIQNGYTATIVQAMAGGTLSKVTGGKFANGAVTSAIQFVVNEQSSNGNIAKGWNTFKANAGRLWGEFKGYWSDTYDQLKSEMLGKVTASGSAGVAVGAGISGATVQKQIITDGVQQCSATMVCYRIGPQWGGSVVTGGAISVNSQSLVEGRSTYHGGFVEIPNVASGNVLFNSSGGELELLGKSWGNLIGGGYQGCEVTVTACGGN